jgi:hypothetical protein
MGPVALSALEPIARHRHRQYEVLAHLDVRVYPNVHVVTATDELIMNRLPLRPG